jgi:hypothetical protein
MNLKECIGGNSWLLTIIFFALETFQDKVTSSPGLTMVLSGLKYSISILLI